MGQYQSYKDSGTEWLGKIPSHWKVNRIASYFTERKTKVSDKDYAPLSVTKMGILPQLENVAKTDDGDNRKLVKKNDFVINSRSDRRGSSGVSSLDGSVSLINIVLEPKQGISPGYCNYLLKSYAFIEEFYRNGHGIVADLWTTRYDEMKTIKICIPTYQEQERISSYLDAATAKIDEAIAQQQRMIDLLNERKRIILANAVARGISEVESVKDSGVSYLGFIPNNWSVIALNYLGSYSKKTVNPSELPNTELLEYSMPAFDNGRVPHTVNSKDLDSAKTRLSESTLLINKLNVHKERIWFVENPSENSVASTEFIPIRIHSANPKFIEYALQNHRITSYLIANSNGATNSQKRVSPDTILGLKLAMPSIDEQERIVKYLDGVYEPFKKGLDACQSVVASLQERKQIIINDVVTGKVKVF